MNYTNLCDIEACADLTSLFNYKIIIWGIGAKGKEISSLLSSTRLEVSAFCDSDSTKWGTVFENKQVLSPWNLQEKYSEQTLCFILCTDVKAQKLILSLLRDLEIENFKALTYFGIKNIFYIHHKNIFTTSQAHADFYSKFKNIENTLKTQYANNWKLLLNSYLDDTSIYLLQPGKVASSTIVESLRGNNFEIYHQHMLAYNPNMFNGHLEKEWNWVISKFKQKKLKIITGVREPLSRDYSAFWQPFSEDLCTAYLLEPIIDSNFYTMYQNYLELLVNKTTDAVLGNRKIMTWYDEFEWFNTHIKETLDIDIYDYNFDKELGYTIIQKNNCEIFLFKAEMIDKIMPKLFKFANLPPESPIKNANLSSEKWYALAYESFKQKLKLPQEYVDHYYKNNRYVDHFYSAAEKEKFMSKWQKHISQM